MSTESFATLRQMQLFLEGLYDAGTSFDVRNFLIDGPMRQRLSGDALAPEQLLVLEADNNVIQ